MSTQALIEAADKLSDIIARAHDAGLAANSVERLEQFQALIGAAYITARHPKLAPMPIAGMIATCDRVHAQFTADLDAAIEGMQR